MLVQELLQWTDRPFVLFGHSMGATLAFEVALGLARDGVTPQGLFVSGRRAPSRFRDERVHLYTDAEFLADLKRLSGTDPQMFDDDVLGMILPALRSDYRAAESYRYQPGPRLACRIVALTGQDDPQVTLDEARAWAEHTSSQFECGVFPGAHFFLNTQVAAVLNLITEFIAGQPLSLPRVPDGLSEHTSV